MDLETIWRRMGVASWLLARVGAIALVGMMLLTAIDVAGRYLFNAPIVGAFEVTEFLVLILIFSFIGYTQREKSHVSIGLLFGRFPKQARITIDFVNHLIALLLLGLMAWMGYKNGCELIEVGEKSGNLGIPHYPFAFFLSIGCLVMCVEFMRDLIRLAISFTGRDLS